MGVLVAALLATVGCATHDAHLKKPPKEAEVYAVPPDDPRYEKPIEYPKESLERDPIQQKAKNNDQLPGSFNTSRVGGPGNTGGIGGPGR
jgi:hypothetical protein